MRLEIFGKEILNLQRFEEKPVSGDSGKPKRFTNDINYQTLYRTRQDIATWRQAVQRAESYISPNRTEYYRLLKDIALDNHLSAVIMQRKSAVLGRDFCLKNESDEEVEDKEELLESEWFYKVLDLALDSMYYGFSLVDLGELDSYEFNNLMLIPRQYVKPELNIVTANSSDLTGIAINDPKYKKWNLYFCKDAYDLGILMKAAPLVLWKKNALAFWSEHTEKFAQPMRVGKTDVNDDAQLKNMEAALRNMGSSFWAVMDKDDSIDLLTSNFGNANTIYENLIDVCNKELSKLILGQTGTTDEKSYAGSANVHKGVLADIIESDCKFLEYQINKNVLPILNMHGFGFEGLKFEFEYKEEPSKEEKAKIDASFMPYVKFDKEYLEETYGIKLAEESMEVDSEKKSLTNSNDFTNSFECKDLSAFYSAKCEVCYTNEITDEVLNLFSEEDKQRFYDGIQSGLYTRESLPVWMYEAIAVALFLNVCKEWGYNSIDEALQSSDAGVLRDFQTNIYIFAGAKVFNLVNEVMSNSITKDNVFGSFNKYNEEYLGAEYTTSALSAASALKWIKQIQVNKDSFKILQYVTKRDNRVRPSHQTLDGIIKPVNSEFWNVYYPPNGWGCRCRVSQLRSGDITDTSNFKNPDDVLDYFLFNPGEDKMIFSDKHPYFDITPQYKEYARLNFGLPIPY
jgi:SPP1 gp7 family putative phage head morphogenesis protein